MTKKIYLKDIFLESIAHDKGSMIEKIPSPCYILCHDSLEWNLKTLHYVAQSSGAKILVALKGYSFWREFDSVREYLDGATCSGLHETLLAYEEIATIKTSGVQNTPKDRELEKNRDIKHKENITCNTARWATGVKTQKDVAHFAHHLLFNVSSKHICVFSPAFKESQIREIVKYATHIIFNSFSQWERFWHIIDSRNNEIDQFFSGENIDLSKELSNDSNKNQKLNKHTNENQNLESTKTQDIKIQSAKIQVGLRINPLYSEVSPPIYNPCVPKSRLGITPQEFDKNIESLAKKYGYKSSIEFFTRHFDGLHFHTHCEQDSESLQHTIPHVTKHFDVFLRHCKWVNFGGGHHITRVNYNILLLIDIIKDFKNKYGVEVFLEPGEAVGWECGDLLGEVVDIIENDGKVAILDVSASCHMPDCLEMPYRPKCYKISRVVGSFGFFYTLESDLGEGVGDFTYRFGGSTCLAGDVIGDYSFNTELNIGDKVAFCDMMHYTIVKNTTFNGVELPSLAVIKNGEFKILKEFGYLDFKERN